MSLFNTKEIAVTRYSDGNFDTPDGSWQEGTIEEFNIKGTWQPANGKDQQALPEGRRSSSVYKLYTNTELRITDPELEVTGDTVISPVSGKKYILFGAGDYTNDLIKHHKYLAVSTKEVG